MAVSDAGLLRISMVVAGLIRVAKGQARVEIPYARGMDMWKLEKSGKFPSATKDAIIDIVKGHGGKHPKYEEDGLVFDVPADKAESALEDIQGLAGIDKAFGKLFNPKKGLHWEREKGAKDQPVKVEKKADPKLEKKSEKYEQKLEKKLEKKPAEKAKPGKAKPGKEEPEESEKPIVPDDPNEWEDLSEAFGVPPSKRPPRRRTEELGKAERGKPAPGKPAPIKPAPGKPAAAPEKKPAAAPAGRRKPGPPPKAKFLKSLDRMSQVVQRSDDQEEIVEAVEDFLDGIRYDSWPETG